MFKVYNEPKLSLSDLAYLVHIVLTGYNQWEAEGKPGTKDKKKDKKKGGGGKWGKKICSKIPGLNVLFLLDSLNEGSPEQAFNDATRPVSEIWSSSDEQ